MVEYAKLPDDLAQRVANYKRERPKTNADRIRMMSDEELARFLSATEFKRCDYRPVQEYDFVVWFEWLKKEADE